MLILGGVVVVLHVCALDVTLYLKLKQMQSFVERLGAHGKDQCLSAWKRPVFVEDQRQIF